MGNFLNRFKKDDPPEIQLAKENLGIQKEANFLSASAYEEVNRNDEKNDLIKWQQNLDDEIQKLKRRLRSEIQNPNTGKWERKTMNIFDKEKNATVEVFVPPLANELFIDYIQSQCEPFMSRNLINANFTEKRVLNILRYTCDDIADAMADNFDQFGIEFTNANLIDRLIKNTIIPGPYRAISGFTKVKDTMIAKRIEGFIDKPGTIDKQKGVFG